MLKTEHYHSDEIEISVSSTEWKEAKILDFNKDPFNNNIIKMRVLADLIVPPEETKAWLGVFINEEAKPRAVIESDLTFSHIFAVEFDTWNVPYGKNTFKIKVKSEHGLPAANTFLEVYVTRFYNLHEMIGLILPIDILSGS